MTECAPDCGACCDPVMSAISPLDMAKMAPWEVDERTRRWYLEELTPLPRKEALARMPWLTQGGKTALGLDGRTGDVVIAFSMFYKCAQFDPETRRCRDYDNRPQPCRDYPFSGKAAAELTHMDRATALPPSCSYRADLGERRRAQIAQVREQAVGRIESYNPRERGTRRANGQFARKARR